MSSRRWTGSRLIASVVSLSGCLVQIVDPIVDDNAGGRGGDTSPAGGSTTGGAGGSGGAMHGCPPEMALVEHASFPDVSFCIDKTEVNRSDYVAFLVGVDGDVANAEQPSECAFNTSLAESVGSFCPDFSTGGDLPANCVDWCDAYAYCAWAGKRLCGSTVDGSALDYDAAVTNDEWHFACSGGLEHAYPYGDTGQICACFIPEEWVEQMMCDYQGIQNFNDKAPVASHPACVGGFPGVFDMQGNVAEWTARCEPGDGSGAERCILRGGGSHSVAGSSYWRCDNLQDDSPRNANPPGAGIRCCKDP